MRLCLFIYEDEILQAFTEILGPPPWVFNTKMFNLTIGCSFFAGTLGPLTWPYWPCIRTIAVRQWKSYKNILEWVVASCWNEPLWAMMGAVAKQGILWRSRESRWSRHESTWAKLWILIITRWNFESWQHYRCQQHFSFQLEASYFKTGVFVISLFIANIPCLHLMVIESFIHTQ